MVRILTMAEDAAMPKDKKKDGAKKGSGAKEVIKGDGEGCMLLFYAITTQSMPPIF